MPPVKSSNMAGGATTAGNSASSFDPEAPVPYPVDEKDVSIKLSGRNLVDEHLFSGWGNLWKGPNKELHAKDSEKQILKVTIQELLEKVGSKYVWDGARCLLVREDTREPAFTIEELSKINLMVDRPLSFHVLEKRCVTFTANKFLLTKLIVADPTGCCCVVSFGDSAIYPAVKVGDILVLSQFRAKKALSDEFNEATSIKKDKIINTELKLNAFDFRKAYLLQGVNTARWCRDFYAEEGLKLAHHLWDDESQQFEFAQNHQTRGALDIGGIVVYVSSVMRAREDSSDSRFFCFRYLQLISSSTQEKPLTVKLFCNNQNWDHQADIVPGISLVLTNVLLVDPSKNCYENHFETSWYTRVLINSEVMQAYLQLRPQGYRTVLRNIVAVKACKQVLANEGLQWTVGGFPTLSINSDKSLAVKKATEYYRPTFSNLSRRETTRLFVLGYVYAITTVTIKDNNNVQMKPFWRSSEPPKFKWYEEVKKKPATAPANHAVGVPNPNDYNVNRWGQHVETFFPLVSQYAFAYIRNVGPPLQVANPEEKIFETYERNVDHYKGPCKPLLMPSVPSEGKNMTDYPLLRPRYFLIDIADPHRKQTITAMYAAASFEVMENKLLSLVGGTVSRQNGASNGKDRQSENEDVPMDVDSEEQPFSEPENTELAIEEQEKRKADTIFGLDLLQLESLGGNPQDNLMVNLRDFTRYLDDVTATADDSASQHDTLLVEVEDSQ